MQTGTASSANSGKKEYSKASVQWFLDDRSYGKPHLSQQQTSQSEGSGAAQSSAILPAPAKSPNTVCALESRFSASVGFDSAPK